MLVCAVEIYTETSLTNTDIGLNQGVFSFVSDRPSFNGVDVIPTFGPDEINVSGYSVSGQTNTRVYYEGILIKESFSGSPVRSIDITSCGSYGNSATASFKIRNDLIDGSTIREYCEANGIVLTNRVVRIYTIVNNVFYMEWQGRISNTSQTETEFTIDCVDDATTIHKILPPNMTNVVTDATTIPVTTENVVTPVVIGNVKYSKLAKLSTAISYLSLTTLVAGKTTQVPAWYFNRQKDTLQSWQYPWTHSDSPCRLELLTDGISFTANDPRLVGSYLSVVTGQNANTDQVYKILYNQASFSGADYAAAHEVTIVYLADILLDSSGLVTAANFNSNASTDLYSYNTKVNPPRASANTWLFQISSYIVNTKVSNDSSITIQQNGRGLNSLYVLDSTNQSYIDVSSLVSVNSTGSLIQLTSKVASATGQALIYEDLGWPIIEFGMFTNLIPSAIVVPAGSVTSTPHKNNLQDRSRLTYYDFGIFAGADGVSQVSFYAKFRTKPFLTTYDKIYFLIDSTLYVTNGNFSFDKMYSRITDIYGKEIASSPFNGLTFPTSPGHAHSGVDQYNFIPNSYYTDYNISADTVCKFLADIDSNPSIEAFNKYFDISTMGTAEAILKESPFFDNFVCELQMSRVTGTPDIWTLDVFIKQATLIGARTVDTVTGDLYTSVVGETTGGVGSDSVYGAFKLILETYDGINPNLIDYGNVPATRSDWKVGRTLTQQQNSIGYLSELATQSFVGIFGNRKGQRALRAWNPSTTDVTTGTGKTSNHDMSLMDEDSITSFEKTDFAQLFNSFQLQYNNDPGLNKFTKLLNVAYVDDLNGFPSPTDTNPDGSLKWMTYFAGLGTSNYADAKVIWDECHQSYVDNKAIQQAGSDISDLYWYNDESLFDPTSVYTGTNSSAYKFLQILASWTTRQKWLVSYSIPINANTVYTELLDCVRFTDAVYTKNVALVGWITSIEVDVLNDRFNLQAILLSADMTATVVAGLDERPSSSLYVDSLDERTSGSDVLDER